MGAALFGGVLVEVVGPLEAVSVLGRFGETFEVVGVGDVGVGSVPEGGG
ncbi:hypothetical protein [Streptomyces sp. NBC_00690]|nr:hypothetical protein [Streptomyces sp. NBC_00690]